MDSVKIIEELNRRFAEPLSEFYKRRIIVWYDEEGEFVEQIKNEDFTLNNARFISLTGSNNYEVKKIIAEEDTTSNILLYKPYFDSEPDDNWLLDVELYSEEFRADLISMWMDEMKLPLTPDMRKCVKSYSKFLGAKVRRDKISSFPTSIKTAGDMHIAVMASICGLKAANPSQVIKSVIKGGLDTSQNDVYNELVSYGAEKTFWSLVNRGTGYGEEEPSLKRLVAHLIVSAVTRTIHQEYLKGYETFYSIPHQAYCYDFVIDWANSEDEVIFRDMAQMIEQELGFDKRLIKLSVEDLVDTEVLPSVNEIILHKLMTDISNHIIEVDKIKTVVEKRRTMAWYQEYKSFYDGILSVAYMQEFFTKHAEGFHLAKAKDIWKAYTNEYYMMDTYYRSFQKSYMESLKEFNSDLQDVFKKVCDEVEKLYKNWFLGNLSENWTNICESDLYEYGYIMDIPRQEKFYDTNIEKDDNRVFVIISDAFRYEAAVELADELKRDTQAKVNISSMQSVFPSITKFGMAALLPHKELKAEIKNTAKTDRLVVLADGESTDSNNREKVLQKANEMSTVIKYKDFLGMSKSELGAAIKGMKVVYIYHDRVDKTSHTDENAVFSACDDAILEIKNIIKMLTGHTGGMHAYVTADHGFLYTYSPLTENQKVDKTTDSSDDVEYGRRYAIMNKGAIPEYLMPVKFLFSDEFDAFAPRENIRIKMSGAGMNFVHGGTSLQEMVVPLVEYKSLRNDSKEYQRNKNKYDTKPVTIGLLSSSHKISKMIFTLNFYQKEAVAENREAATYQLYFTDSNGKQVSDVQKIIADKTSDEGQDRTFRVGFNLKPIKFVNTETYYLVITDENGIEVGKEEFQIDIAFATDDFGFF